MDCFGTFFQLCDYGGTYDPFIGGTITGVPKGVEISIAELQAEMTRRAPSPQDFFSTKREEKETGRIEKGSNSGQILTYVDKYFSSCAFHKVSIKILPDNEKIYEADDLKHKKYCPECGSKLKPTDKFCSQCGHKV